MKSFLKEQYLSHCRPNPGLYGLENAEQVYENYLFINTSVRYKAQALHEIGLAEVERINALMHTVQKELFDGSMQEFREALKDKSKYPSLYFDSDDQILQAYRSHLEKIDEITPKLFAKFPKHRKCAIEPVPAAMSQGVPYFCLH